jgi:hypothetical protein
MSSTRSPPPFGLVDGEGLEFYVRFTQWATFDHNDNGFVCMMVRPITPGLPSYTFNGVDDQSSTSRG